MQKTTEVSVTAEEAKILAQAIGEQVKVLERLEASCLREDLAKAAAPIKAQVEKLGELKARFVEIHLNGVADGYARAGGAPKGNKSTRP
jgi:hypothetical protein